MKTSFDLSHIMKNAWRIFRLKQGPAASPRQFTQSWRECLRNSWQAAKDVKAAPDAELIALGAKLEIEHRRFLQGLSNAHAALRATIDAIPAQSKPGRDVKRRALDLAMNVDAECETVALGSFSSLSRSIARDALASMPALAAMSIISRLPQQPGALIAA